MIKTVMGKNQVRMERPSWGQLPLLVVRLYVVRLYTWPSKALNRHLLMTVNLKNQKLPLVMVRFLAVVRLYLPGTTRRQAACPGP